MTPGTTGGWSRNSVPPSRSMIASAPAAVPPGRPCSPWGVFAVAAGAVFVVSLDATIMIAAFPALRDVFAPAPPSTLSWVLNAYTIIYAALLAPAGRLADLYGRKRLFVFGVVGFTLASAACAVAPDALTLVASRSLQAVGAALLTPTSLALILAAFPKEKRAIVVGLWGAVGALAAAIGPAAGAALIDATSWRMVFAINLPIGAGLTWWAWHRLTESASPETGARLDGVGVGLIVLGVAALTFALVQVDPWGWSALGVWLAAFIGLLCLQSYVVWAWGRRSAAIDLGLFAERSYAMVTIATFVFGTGFALLFLGSYLFLITVWQFSPAWAGLALTPGPLMVIPVAVLAGRRAATVGHRSFLVAGGLLFAGTQAVLWALVDATPAYWSLWFPIQILGGVSVGLILPALSGAAVAKLPPTRFGVGGAVNNAVRQFGGVIGTAIAIVLVGHDAASLEAFRQAFLVLVLVGLLTAVVCLAVDTRPDRVAQPA